MLLINNNKMNIQLLQNTLPKKVFLMWLESFVRDPQKRAILMDLVQLSSWIGQQVPVDAERAGRSTTTATRSPTSVR